METFVFQAQVSPRLCPAAALTPSGNWVLRGSMRNWLQRAHGRCRETGQEAEFLEPSLSFFVLGSRFSLITSLGACCMPALHTLHSSWGGRRFLPYLSPLFILETVQGQHQRAGRMKRHGLHYGYNIILVMLTGRKNKGHLCHLLVQAWARCLFLGPLSLNACASRSF